MTTPHALTLTLTTPLALMLDHLPIVRFRGEDATGGFGLLPGHADFLTVIDAGVLRWTPATGPVRYAAVRGAVLTVQGGTSVAVACREAILGDDLPRLEAEVTRQRHAARDTGRQARAHATQLHARAIRRLMAEMALSGDSSGLEGTEWT
ncbi:MAG: F0F1 ATP synthase subunit epsilon [Rhodobacter sp.]|nr:F0F1 ATP synthase subunit epsilon [Paracoccaceae bacterium]MCC0080389.1 F0F1 ATP synthase subunit epsilon [Rhodobacter sp.]